VTTQIVLELVGRQPLLVHNIDMANPMGTTAKAIAEISGKRKKTDADRAEMSKLEWYGGLYLAPGIDGPAFPTRAIRKALIEGARINKMGKQIERGLSFEDMYVPIAYDGPRDIDQLYASGEFSDLSMVRVGAARVARTRPRFTEWAMVATGWIEDDILNLADLSMIADHAGRSCGLGDNRFNGFGRFTATVKAMVNR
jgi:hypothetical protein